MLGNVWEWASTNAASYVVRGGGFGNRPNGVRASGRVTNGPSYQPFVRNCAFWRQMGGIFAGWQLRKPFLVKGLLDHATAPASATERNESAIPGRWVGNSCFLPAGQQTQVFCPPEDGKISIVPPMSGAQPKRNPFSGRSAIYFQEVFRWEQDNKTSAIHNRINVIRPPHLYFPCSQMHPSCREGKMDALPRLARVAAVPVSRGFSADGALWFLLLVYHQAKSILVALDAIQKQHAGVWKEGLRMARGRCHRFSSLKHFPYNLFYA